MLGIMAKTYITDLTHFLNDADDFPVMPLAARKMAAFLTSVIEAVKQNRPTGNPPLAFDTESVAARDW